MIFKLRITIRNFEGQLISDQLNAAKKIILFYQKQAVKPNLGKLNYSKLDILVSYCSNANVNIQNPNGIRR